MALLATLHRDLLDALHKRGFRTNQGIYGTSKAGLGIHVHQFFFELTQLVP